MFYTFSLVALIVGSTSADTWFGDVPAKPAKYANKEGCYIKEIDDVILFKKTISAPIGQCYSITCYNHNMIAYDGCGVVDTDDPNCHVVNADATKEYPACCKDVKCNDG